MVFEAKYSNTHVTDAARTPWVTRLLLLVFLVVCIFDPADKIVGGKVAVFVAIWIATLVRLTLTRDDIALPAGLVVYVAAFVAIPLLSILWYYITSGQQPFEGFVMFKAYLLVSLAMALVLNEVDLLPQLCATLSVLAVAVNVIFVAILQKPDVFGMLYPLGDSTGLLFLDRRGYGDFKLLQVYFVTSPMLAISIAYYLDRALSLTGAKRIVSFLLALLSITGMLLAGTRNNIFAALVLPFLIWPIYTNRVLLNTICSLGILAVLALPFAEYFSAFLDPVEFSNHLKLATIQDYYEIFSDPVTLLFGQGLGVYQSWSAKTYSYITELTYLEMIRNFGLPGAAS